MFFKSTVMGRITHTPEFKTATAGDIPIAKFTVAVNHGRRGENEETSFVNCTAWRKTAEFVNKFFTKGQMIIVFGDCKIRKYTGRDGTEKNSVEMTVEQVFFGESKQARLDAAEQREFEESKKTKRPAFVDIDAEDFDDDGTLPF